MKETLIGPGTASPCSRRFDDWQNVQELFHAAADLPPGEQRLFLDAACADRPEIRREVESLLVSDRKGDRPITAAVEGAAQDLLGADPIVGSRVGRWRVVREIGRGGMGAVYLAVRDDDFRQQAALKLVKYGMDTAEVLERFRRERQILANLDHPFIARLIDGGSAPDGRPFLVMEYVEGQPIDSWSRDQNLSVEDRCRLFLKVCAEAILAALARASPGEFRYQIQWAIAQEYIGHRLRGIGRLPEAIDAYRQSLAGAESLLAANPADRSLQSQVVASSGGLAVALAASGDRAAALDRARADIVRTETFRARSPDKRASTLLLARAWLALASARRALAQSPSFAPAQRQSDWREARAAAGRAIEEISAIPGGLDDPYYSAPVAQARALIAESAAQ